MFTLSTHPGMRCGCISGKLSGTGGIKGKQMVTEVFKKPDSHQGVYNLGVFFYADASGDGHHHFSVQKKIL